MGSLLQIRDVPDEARRALKARAAARGQSLNAYLLDMINREVARALSARRASSGTSLICSNEPIMHTSICTLAQSRCKMYPSDADGDRSAERGVGPVGLLLAAPSDGPARVERARARSHE